MAKKQKSMLDMPTTLVTLRYKDNGLTRNIQLVCESEDKFYYREEHGGDAEIGWWPKEYYERWSDWRDRQARGEA